MDSEERTQTGGILSCIEFQFNWPKGRTCMVRGLNLSDVQKLRRDFFFASWPDTLDQLLLELLTSPKSNR